MPQDLAFTNPAARRLGRRIKARRDLLAMTQDQLAAVSGVTQPTISRIERGLAMPSVQMLLKLRAALGLPDDEFRDWLDAVA